MNIKAVTKIGTAELNTANGEDFNVCTTAGSWYLLITVTGRCDDDVDNVVRVWSTDRGASLCEVPSWRLSGGADERETEPRSCVTVASPLFTLDRRRSPTQSLSEDNVTARVTKRGL